MKSVCTLLDLSADASEEAVHAAVTKLKNRIITLEPFEAENMKLKNRVAEFDNEQCVSLLDLCGVKEEKLRNRLADGMKVLKNREDRLAYLADFGHKPGEAKKPAAETRTHLLNRGGGKTTETAGEETDEKAFTAKIKNRANELQGKNPKLSFDECWSQARTELEQEK